MANGYGYYGKRTLRELAMIVFSRWITIVLITAIVTGLTAIACLYMPKVYRSKVTFWTKLNRAVNPLTEKGDPAKRLEVFLKTQYQIIYSDIVLRRTLARVENPEISKSPADPMVNPSASVSRWEEWYDKVNLLAKKIPAKRVAKFKKKIQIKTPGGEDIGSSEVFTIVVDQVGTAEKAKLTADILAQEYIIRRRELRMKMNEAAKELVNRQLEELREKVLGTAEKKFNEFIRTKVNGNLLDLTQLMYANGEVNNQRIRTIFQQKLISLDAEIGEYNALKKEIEAQIPEKALKEGVDALSDKELDELSPVVPEKVLKNNSIIDKLKKKLADLIIDRNSLKEQYTDDFKLLRQKSGEIRRVKKDILRELIAELKAIDQHIATLKARKLEIQKEVDGRNKIIDKLSGLYVEYESLMKELELARKLYAVKRKDLLDAETARQMAEREVLITKVDEATMPDPDKPVRPIFWLYTTVALIVGLLMGVGHAFIADSYDHTIKSIDQAERYLGKTVLASIPEVRGGIVR